MTIKELRVQTGMTQRQFANHYGINLRTLQDWEQERFKMPDYVFQMIVRIIELENMQNIQFKDDRHKTDYLRFLNRMKHEKVCSEMMERQDGCHKAVAYLLALDKVLAEHSEEIFDFSNGWMKMDKAIQYSWQSCTSLKTTRLMMNLWNGHCSDDEEEEEVSPGFTALEIFACENAPYFWEAIKLRFPQYCKPDKFIHSNR